VLRLTIETENAAFEGDAMPAEVARILRHTADRIEAGDFSGLYQTVRDSNGNACGTFRLKPCDCANPCEHLPTRSA